MAEMRAAAVELADALALATSIAESGEHLTQQACDQINDARRRYAMATAEPDIDWQKRALKHAAVIRALLSPKAEERDPDSALQHWLNEAKQSLHAGGIEIWALGIQLDPIDEPTPAGVDEVFDRR